MASFNEAYAASLEYFCGDSIAAQKFVSKYALKDKSGEFIEKTPDEMHRRLARELARIESKYPNALTEDQIYELFREFRDVVAQGSPMAGIGNNRQFQSLSNCFVIESPYDSYGGILKADQELVQIMKRRGGVGLDVSTIRPRGLLTANAAQTTDGIGVFMERYSNSCREVAQGGRRGALMLTISCHHPQIRDFIHMKEDLKKVTGANVSIRLSDEFMQAVKGGKQVQLRFPVEKHVEHSVEQYVDARELWNEMILSAHNSAEPGLLFWDNIISRSPADIYADKGFATKSTNPCLTGDTKVAVADGRGLVFIKQLADEGKDVPVYASDGDGKIVIKMMRNPRITGHKVPVFKVTIEGGHSFRATANHQLYLLDGSTKRVDEIKINDQLCIANRKVSTLVSLTDGRIKKDDEKYIVISTSANKKSEHRLIWESINGKVKKKHVIHHKDFNSLNNSIENLECLTAIEHRELHAKRMLGDNNPMRRAKTDWSAEDWKEYHDNMSKSVSGLKNGRAYKDVSNEMIKEHALNFTKALGRRFSKNEWMEYCVKNDIPMGSDFRQKELGTAYELGCWAAVECGVEYADVDPRLQRTYKDAISQGYEASIVDGAISVKRMCEECKKDFWMAFETREVAFCGTSCANRYVNKNTDTNARRTLTINSTYIKKAEQTKKKILDVYTELRFKNGKDPMQKDVFELCRERNIPYRLNTKHGFKSWDDIKEAAKIHNHRVVSVEHAGEEDVYNGTVDDVHNFYFGWDENHFKVDQLLIKSKNCGELPLSPYDSCRLMLVNLYSFVENPYTNIASFNFVRFKQIVEKAQRLMDDMIDLEIECIEKIINKIKLDPEPESIKATELNLWHNILTFASTGRRTGLGITALGDMLASLGLRYGSQQSIDVVEKVYKELTLSTYRSSAILAAERGAFAVHDYEREKNHPFMRQLFDADPELEALVKKHGRRNIACNTTAPAGTVSLLTQTTSGIEPAFLLNYTRRAKISENDKNARVDFVDESGDKWQEFEVFHHGFKKWMEITGKGPDDVKESPYWQSTSADIDWESKIRMQAAAQKWVDHSISNCLTGDTLIETKDGLMYLDELCSEAKIEGEFIDAKNIVVKNYKMQFVDASHIFNNGVKPIVRIVLSNGLELKSTPNERVLININEVYDWVKVEHVKPGMKLLLSNT